MTSLVVTPADKQELSLLENLLQKMNIEFKALPTDKDEEIDSRQWYEFSMQNFSGAYSNDEPEYTSDMIKEPNPEYTPTLYGQQ